MTDEQIIELLATKVMGWESPKFLHYESFSGAWVRDEWNPLLKIEHAWMVVEKLRKELCCIKFDSDHHYAWEVFGIRDEDDDHSTPTVFIRDEDICRAIALFALKVKGISYDRTKHL